MTASSILAGNREAELKPASFSSLLLSRFFLSFLFAKLPSDIVPLTAACWGYSFIIIIIIIIKELSQQAALRGTISLGCREKRKYRKARKSRSEEKVVGFSSVSLYPARKREAVTQGGTREIDHPMRRKTQRAGIAKGWEDN